MAPRCLGGDKHACDFRGAATERLFAKHVFAGLERADAPLAMQPVVQRVDDHVHVPVGQQRFVAGMRVRDVVLGRDGAGAKAAPAVRVISRADPSRSSSATSMKPPQPSAA